MTTYPPKLLISAGLFILIFAFGYWVSHAGKPFPVFLLTIHKLASLAAIVLLTMEVVQQHKVAPLAGVIWTLFICTALLFVVTILTGGFISMEKEMPTILTTIHHLAPYLTLVSTAATIYLLVKQS